MKKLLFTLLLAVGTLTAWADDLFIVGNATAHNDYAWGDTRNSWKLVETGTTNVYSWTGLLKQGRFKICTGLETWDAYQPETDNLEIDASGTEQAIVYVADVTGAADNQWKVVNPGIYVVTVNSSSKTISITPDWTDIETADDLIAFAESVNSASDSDPDAARWARLTADIDMSGKTFPGIGRDNKWQRYHGTFDGQQHKISNLNMTSEHCAFVTVAGGGCTIKNLLIDNTCEFNGTGRIAALISACNYTDFGVPVTIECCGNEANVTGTGDNCAGLLGCNYSGSIHVTIKNCFNTGNISSTGSESAPISGWTGANATISNTWNIGEIANEHSNNSFLRWDGNGSSYTNCFTTLNWGSSINGKTLGYDSNKVSSGELCYNLNGVSGGTNWFQTIGTDNHPVPFNTHKTVYFVSPNYKNLLLIDGNAQIANATDLQDFSSIVNSGFYTLNAELTNDIDMSDETWTPIGATDDTGTGNVGDKAYKGTFDGQGYTIDNLVQTESNGYSNQGLFGVVNGGCIIRNLILGSGCNFYGAKYVGAFVGSSRGSGWVTIENCGNEANVGSSTHKVGAHAAAFIGVVVSSGPATKIINCYNKGNVYGADNSDSAILTGWFGGHGSVQVKNFYNVGSVTGYESGKELYRNEYGITFNNVYDSTGKQSSTAIGEGWLASGELCYRLGSAFTQDLSEEGYPTFGSKAVTAGQWFSNSNDVYYNLEDGNYTVYQLNMSDTQTKYAVPASVTAKNVCISRTIPDENWIGLCLPFDYDIPSGWDVRVLDHVNGTGDEACMVFTAASSIEAGKPYIVKPTDEVTSITATNKSIATAASTVEEGDVNMIGNFAQTSIPVGSFYINNNSELKKLTAESANLKGFRAYFTVDGSSTVKALNFAFDDDADGISPLLTSPEEEGQIYNLAGQRIQKVQKGINIVNGRKVLF